MTRYVLEVSENIYGGNHGYFTGGVFEIGADEIWDYAIKLGTDLIDSYFELIEAHEGEEPADYIDYIAALIGSEWDNKSTAELGAKYAELGWDQFVDTYTGEYPNF